MAVFSRSSNEPDIKPVVTSIGQTSPPPMPVAAVARSATGNLMDRANASVIGRDLVIMGQQIVIVTQGILQVDGEVRGDLRGKEVIIGEHGRVTGTVAAESVQVRGTVNGAIRGLSVTLLPTARVEGDIHHQTLAITEGATFDGRVRRPKDTSELQPILDPGHYAGGSGSTLLDDLPKPPL
jgi:cytoskeletal protein CcmA (bactofilin family)